jgi:hypothetical protein
METDAAEAAPTPGSPALIEFLRQDYELKVGYLVDHYGRIWMRFNFFIATHTALSVAFFGGFDARGAFSRAALPIAVLGAVSAVCWYGFGAEDRFLVAVYREQVTIVARQLARALDLPRQLAALGLAAADGTYVAVGDVSQTLVRRTPYQWRVERFSTTKLVAWFPMLVTVYWIALVLRTLAG